MAKMQKPSISTVIALWTSLLFLLLPTVVMAANFPIMGIITSSSSRLMANHRYPMMTMMMVQPRTRSGGMASRCQAAIHSYNGARWNGSSAVMASSMTAAFVTSLPSSSSSTHQVNNCHHRPPFFINAPNNNNQKASISFLTSSSLRPSLSTKLLLSNKPTTTSSNTTSLSGAKYHATVNQQLVQRRNELSRQKRAARQKALEKDRERNLRLRSLFLEENQQQQNANQNANQVTTIDGVQKNNGQADADGDGGAGESVVGVPPMFAVKVVTCPTLRSELKMNGREKRGRMFVERPLSFSSSIQEVEDEAGGVVGNGEDLDGDGETAEEEYACTSLRALKQTIHEFFRRLKKSTYVLSASLPILDEEGNVLTHADDFLSDTDGTGTTEQNDTTMLGTWPLESDNDVRQAFAQAEQFFHQHHLQNQTSALKRPTLVLHVTKDPNAPPPPPPPPYLSNMPNPHSSATMTMLSFYAFPPLGGIPDPESTAEQLRKLWRPFKALGRVYVATEGVNAQMAVPTNVLSNFLQCCTLPPSEGGELYNVLGPYMENGMNIDPIPVSMEEFNKEPAFKNMHIRVRSQIVADGFERPLDWSSAGYDMPPLEWHAKLKEAREAQQKSQEAKEKNEGDDNNDGSGDSKLPIVLDCRNNYETQVGKFELAEPLETENFRDSWDVLKERLRDVPKDAPIMTYCTGGIRCVKVNAYLTQELEFTNVSRLAGGVVAYDRTLNEQAPTEEPMFKGVNYVFDGRMGRRITDDQLGTCHTCGSKTHLVSNCKNENCHRRMVQCEYCRDSFFGTCSEGCKGRVVNSGMAPMRDFVGKQSSIDRSLFASNEDSEEKKEEEFCSDGTLYSNLDDYSYAHSTDCPSLLKEIESNTAHFLASGAHMVSGSMQGSLLTTLASMSREGRILEIGTFTGYATACFLEGAAAAGACLGTDNSIGTRDGGGPFVLSLERDRRALGLAVEHLKAMAEHGIGDEGALEAAKLRSVSQEANDFDGDSISFTYKNIAGCQLLRVNDALATVEEMALNNPPHAAFDIVFVDADKTRLMEYVDALVSNDNVLKKGGLILVDNVLWKGLVMDAASGYDSSSDDEASEDKEMLKKNRRARKLASKMHRFNSAVVKDDRVDVLMMNLRDGLSMIRKR